MKKEKLKRERENREDDKSVKESDMTLFIKQN